MTELINWNDEATTTAVFPYLTGKKNATAEIKTQRPFFSSNCSKLIFSVETFARLELFLVKEVEAVLIDRESGGGYRIISVVNDRDLAIRERVYAREEAIMAEYPAMKFDFHVLARMNRKLEDIITKTNKVIFAR